MPQGYTAAPMQYEPHGEEQGGYQEVPSKEDEDESQPQSKHLRTSQAPQVSDPHLPPGDAKLGIHEAGIIFFKSCFGVGILGIPFAFRNAGVIPGVLSVLLIALLTNISTKLLVWTKRNLQTQTGLTVTSVPQMALATFGTRGLRFASFVLMTTQLGTTVAYNIFLGVSLTAIVEDLFPAMHHGIGFSYESYHPYVFFIMCQVMLFSVMVQMNDVASMTPLLMFAQFAMTCAMVLIITNGMVNPSVCDRDGTGSSPAPACPSRPPVTSGPRRAGGSTQSAGSRSPRTAAAAAAPG